MRRSDASIRVATTLAWLRRPPDAENRGARGHGLHSSPSLAPSRARIPWVQFHLFPALSDPPFLKANAALGLYNTNALSSAVPGGVSRVMRGWGRGDSPRNGGFHWGNAGGVSMASMKAGGGEILWVRVGGSILFRPSGRDEFQRAAGAIRDGREGGERQSVPKTLSLGSLPV